MKTLLKNLKSVINLINCFISGLVGSLCVIRNGKIPTYLEVDDNRYQLKSNGYLNFYQSFKKELGKFKLRRIDFDFRELYYSGHTKNNIKEFELFYDNFIHKLTEYDKPSESNNLSLCTSTVSYIKPKSKLIKMIPFLTLATLLVRRTNLNKTVLHYSLQYAYYFLYYYENFCIKKNSLPKLVIFSNDHTPRYLAASKVCRQFSISRIYIQHGFVSKLFPKLDFELSILWNRKSKEIYKEVGSLIDDSVVELSREVRQEGVIGLPKHKLQHVEEQGEKIVVIFPTSLPDLIKLNEIIEILVNTSYIKSVYVQPHPRDSNVDQISNYAKIVKNHIEIGDEFIAIVGNSSIAMELSLKGISVFQYFDLDNIGNDYYGFVEGSLTKQIEIDSILDSTDGSIFERYQVPHSVIESYCPIADGKQEANKRKIEQYLDEIFEDSVRYINKERINRIYNSNKKNYKLIKKIIDSNSIKKERIFSELVKNNVISNDEYIVLKEII
ncbi:hypothetical protein [Vibrio splendidus]|uniref:hypothetical protein n=1 Tax=Vibrio splendidus TaxID=29497 RepID=UPI000E329B4D|nr:hypothetical protein [Vibrio splendidus]